MHQTSIIFTKIQLFFILQPFGALFFNYIKLDFLSSKTKPTKKHIPPLLLSFKTPHHFSFFDFRDRSILNPKTRTQNPQRIFKTSLYRAGRSSVTSLRASKLASPYRPLSHLSLRHSAAVPPPFAAPFIRHASAGNESSSRYPIVYNPSSFVKFFGSYV